MHATSFTRISYKFAKYIYNTKLEKNLALHTNNSNISNNLKFK